MTITEINQLLRSSLKDAAKRLFDVDIENIVIEQPPKTELGDFALTASFEIAKQIKAATGEKANPRAIGEALKDEITSLDIVERVEVAGAGYLNVFLKRADFLNNYSQNEKPVEASRQKVCVEHTSVNPNKAAHIGHVRNSVLGDTFQRILKANGQSVEVQNYIDNTGVQVADVVVGFIYLEGRDLNSIKSLYKELQTIGKSFDYYCWDLYAKVGQEYQTNEELKERRAEVLHAIEAGGNDVAEIADYVATRNVECITQTMERLGIRYDLLPRESEILHLHFWDKAFERMKELGVVRFESEGKHAGCWVMPFEEHSGTDDHESDKILVRSNGTVTYTGKDIAYQMWKLGLLGMDFYYKKFWRYPDGKEIWITTSNKDDADASAPQFGHGEMVFNVIDSRQSYPQEIVKKGVAAIAPDFGEAASVHLSYEMVALSPAAAEQLGFELSDEDRKKTFIEMSGRKGLGVKADDLIDRLIANALIEVQKRHADISLDEQTKIAKQIAVGALRYFLLKFTRNTVIVFDFDDALSFEGETGAFCQYSAVRANSIFRKLDDAGLSLSDAKAQARTSDEKNEIFSSADGNDIWSLIMLAARADESIAAAAASREPAGLAKYAFQLAKAFNLFYHNHKIIAEPDAVKRAIKIVSADIARNSLIKALDTLGIEVPEKM